MDTITLRPETEADAPAIKDVVDKAFDDENTSLLVRLIRERGNARLATVALSDDRVVGYILASPLALDQPQALDPPQPQLNCLGIAPVAVTPELQGRDIGGRLMRYVIEHATGSGIDALFLLGHTSYYPRFGFAPAYIGNEYGATDAFMSLELRAGCLDGVDATAKYVSEFAESGA